MDVATSSRFQFLAIPGGLLLALCLSVLLSAPASALNPAAAEVRISEILANPFGNNTGQQKVELRNYGTSSIDIGGWRIANEFDSMTLPTGLLLEPGKIFVVHIAANGVASDQEAYTGDGWQPLGVTQGSFALYITGGGLDDPDAMVDFVEWGAGDQLGEAVASAAGLWPAGDFVPLNSEGNSIQLCNRQVSGSGAWLEVQGDTIGGVNNCATDVTDSTWGKLKDFYR